MTTENINECEDDYIPEFDCVDLDQYTFQKDISQLEGKAYEVGIQSKKISDTTLQFAMPIINVSDDIGITNEGVNGFFRTKLNDSSPGHLEFKKWTKQLDNWIVSNVVSFHKQWFGKMWEKNGPLYGQPYPSKEAIQNMFHPTIDDEEIFCARVHMRRNEYTVQVIDDSENELELSDIRDCQIIPLLEVKGVFFKPNGYNIDFVLRGIAKTSQESELLQDAQLFHVDSVDDEEDAQYLDYATDDGTDSQVSTLDNIEDNVLSEFENSTPVTVEEEESDNYQFNINDKKLKELMLAAEKAKSLAENAQNEYKQYLETSSAN